MSKQFSKSFYNSAKWIKTRDAYIAERMAANGGLCEDCGEAVGEELHHIVPLSPANISDPEITLGRKNLRWLCKDCHFKAHRAMIAEQTERAREGRRKILQNGCYMDENGFLQKQKVFVVWGAPASGKSTYVAKNKVPGDIVLDLDLLKSALCGERERCEGHEVPLSLVLAVRDFILGQVQCGAVDCKNVWVIASLPRRAEREELRERLNAELVYIDSDYHECLRRARADPTRRDLMFHQYVIDKWFEAVEW